MARAYSRSQLWWNNRVVVMAQRVAPLRVIVPTPTNPFFQTPRPPLRKKRPSYVGGLFRNVIGEEQLSSYRSNVPTLSTLVKSPLQFIVGDIKTRKIAVFLLLSTAFMVVEFVYGFHSNSLGLISDACHMLFDCAALAIGLYASYISKLQANSRFNYGYGRFEVISGYMNAVFLILVASLIVLESLERILDPPEISTESLLVVSVGGFLVNVVGLLFFHEAHHHHPGGSCAHVHSNKEKSSPAQIHLRANGGDSKFVDIEDHHHHHQIHKGQGEEQGCSGNHLGYVHKVHGHSHAAELGNCEATHAHGIDCGHQHSDHVHNDGPQSQNSSHSHVDMDCSSCSGGHGHNHDHHHEHEHQLAHQHTDHNMQGIFLHILADTLGSVGVVVSTLLIKYRGWYFTDPACSIFISALIIASVIPLVRSSAEMLLQRMPRGVEGHIQHLMKQVNAINGVSSCQALHVWTFTNTEVIGSLHLLATRGTDKEQLRTAVARTLKRAGITDLTLQVETV